MRSNFETRRKHFSRTSASNSGNSVTKMNRPYVASEIYLPIYQFESVRIPKSHQHSSNVDFVKKTKPPNVALLRLRDFRHHPRQMGVFPAVTNVHKNSS